MNRHNEGLRRSAVVIHVTGIVVGLVCLFLGYEFTSLDPSPIRTAILMRYFGGGAIFYLLCFAASWIIKGFAKNP